VGGCEILLERLEVAHPMHASQKQDQLAFIPHLFCFSTGRTRQLPLRFTSGYPECSSCCKAALVKDYGDRQLYSQLLYYQQLFDVGKASTRCGRNFGGDLAAVRGAAAAYADLRQHVDRALELNNYSVVDMTRLFAPFAAANVSSARFRRSHAQRPNAAT